nr:MAG TPA: hypothetical protein [Caudoviricetes sp.]
MGIYRFSCVYDITNPPILQGGFCNYCFTSLS